MFVDDAYHFLNLKGLAAHDCTVEKISSFDMAGKQADLTNGETVLSGAVDNNSSTCECAIAGHRGSPANTNDIPHDKAYKNACHTAPGDKPPKILVWSAGDESGIGRLEDVWQEYFLMRAAASASGEMSFVNEVTYTPHRCRSSLPWKAFATVDSASKLTQINDLISRPVRSGGGHKLAFAFTGQGPVYNGMGLALSAFPLFKDALEAFDREVMRRGCEWSSLVKGPRRPILSPEAYSETNY